MTDISQTLIDEQVSNEMREIAQSILTELEQGNTEEAVGLVNNLNQVREKTLFNEIGKLTRGLHEAIKNMNVDIETDGHESEFTRTADKLNYVLTMTDRSANRTMDLAEEAMPIVSSILKESHELSATWKRFTKKELSTQDFRQLSKNIDKYLQYCASQSHQVQGHLSEIVLAQDFQDLTGQVIQKVIALIVDIEDRLVSLLTMAGSLDKLSGNTAEPEEIEQVVEAEPDIKAEGPQIDKTKENVMQNQDEVDDLLSSLGF